MSSLLSLRSQISTLDTELLRILDERMEVARQIGEYKKSEWIPVIDEKREQEILSKIPESYRYLWDEMMDISKRKQHSLEKNTKKKVAIQWGKWSFNEIAIQDYMRKSGEEFEIIYSYTTSIVLKMIARGEVDYGQFAIANSIGGLVQETLDTLGSKRWNYRSHYAIPVRHCLMIHSESMIEDIDTIMGHEQAIRQCEQTLEKKFPHLKKIWGTGELIDNAAIAESVASGKLPKSTANIGHESLAEIYWLKIIERNIQDRNDNMTTFVLIQK